MTNEKQVMRLFFLYASSILQCAKHIVEAGGGRMSEMSDVRRRIQNRRYGNKAKEPFLFRLCYRGVMGLMALGIAVLAFLVNERLNLIELPQEWSQISFAQVSEWLPFERWFHDEQEDQSVAALPMYSLMNDNKYANGTNQAHLLLDGVVLHVEERDGAQSSVTVRHDNGVVVTYGHLHQVLVKQDERLKKGDVAGSFQDYVTLDMVKNKQSVDLPTALQP